jgi:hypothetical protein
MKLKVKQGEKLITSFYHSKRHGNNLLINLVDRWTYQGFKQIKNRLIISTEKGKIEFVFAGEVVKLAFDHEEKDQIVFSYIEEK